MNTIMLKYQFPSNTQAKKATRGIRSVTHLRFGSAVVIKITCKSDYTLSVNATCMFGGHNVDPSDKDLELIWKVL